MEQYERYVGAVFDGRYKIDKIIGIGGMAVVYRAQDMLMNRVVAVKMLKEEIADDEESVKRFINESKAVAMMSHPNIVNIYDVSVRDDAKYIVMEYVEGITLRNYMSKRGQLTLREIISYIEQILSALSHAHSKGIVHRDIKPQNIMLLKNGIIKVTDFGIAKLPNAETVTMTDKAIGTVYYISPEQASGEEIDQRSDLYSLGVMMYEMATGELPFTADSPVSVAMMQINDTARAPGEINPNMPKGLEQIIGIAMEKEPDYRYQNAEDMLRQIRRLKENPNIVFRIPKHKGEEDGRGIMSIIFNGGPVFPVIAGVALAFFIVFAIGASYVFSRVMKATTQTSETITVANFVGSFYTDELSQWFDSSDVYKLTVEYQYSDGAQSGVILAQDPQADSSRKVIAGEQYCELTLTVCSGQQTVPVPDLAGMDYREAKQKIKSCELLCQTEYISDEIFTSGQVIKTAPAAGETATVGTAVTVYISSGPADGETELPRFVGMNEQQAFSKLMELSLLPGKITYVKDANKAGIVIAQTQAEGTKVSPFSKINLTVSGGPDYDPNDPDGSKKAQQTKPADTTAAPTTTKAPDTTTAETTEKVTTAEDTTEKKDTTDTTSEDTTAKKTTTAADTH